MAQSQGSAEDGREAGHIGKEEYRSDEAAGTPNFLCTSFTKLSANLTLITISRPTKWFPSYLEP